MQLSHAAANLCVPFFLSATSSLPSCKACITMAESTIPTPPQTPPPAPEPFTPEPVSEGSFERLDCLLETYLELLDEYTALRTKLSKQFSDGFYSLARANHTSASLGSGRRYGEEGYDERMKAARGVVYSVEGSGDGSGTNSIRVEEKDCSGQAEREDQPASRTGYRLSIRKTNDVANHAHTSRGISKQPHGTEELECSSTAESAVEPGPSPTRTRSTASPKNKASAEPPASCRDPLNWYGILVPQPLRQAQASFVSAVESSIPQLLNTSALMGDLETQITTLRIELGLQPGKGGDDHADKGVRA